MRENRAGVAYSTAKPGFSRSLARMARELADLLGKPNPFAPAIMPERLALTEPSQQVKEIIGSGPVQVRHERACARLTRRV